MADDTLAPPSPSRNDLLQLKMSADVIATEETLGTGSFGHVFAGSCSGLRVAIKYVAMPSLAEEATLLAREMVYGSGLSHPNVVRMLHAPVICDNGVFMVMRRHDTTLRRVVLSQPLSHAHRKLIFSQILAGLQHIHDFGLVHRDIKTDNIFIDADCSTVIGDLGMMCSRLDPYYRKHRLSGYVVTRWYRAPEIFFRVPYTEKVDMWACGCVLLEMIEGRCLLCGKTTDEHISQLLKTLYGIDENVQKHSYALLKDMCNHISMEDRRKLIRCAMRATPEDVEVDALVSMLSFDPVRRRFAWKSWASDAKLQKQQYASATAQTFAAIARARDQQSLHEFSKLACEKAAEVFRASRYDSFVAVVS